MIRPIIQYSSAAGAPDYHYITFDSVLAFHHFVDHQSTQLQQANYNRYLQMQQNTEFKIQRQSQWYGTPIPEGIEVLNSHTHFLGMYLAKKVQQQIKKQLHRYLQLTTPRMLPKPKLAHNSKGLGIFSFDRAVMGMYRVQPTAKDTPIQRITSQMKIALDTGNKATTIKDVFTHFKDRKASYPSLSLYIMAGANADVAGDGLLYVGLACAALVDYMELRGVAVEVNVLIGTAFEHRQHMAVVRVKRFQDRLDKNQLLLISSDPRYFRYKGFKALIALANYFGRIIPEGLGRIDPHIGKDFVARTDTSNSYAVFEQSYSIEDAVAEITRIITTYTKAIPYENN
jgi:hypothetical protein